MTDSTERDEQSGVATTGHDWDGIRELDNPLPRWWLYIWYGCIVAAIIYWVLMPAWPMVNGYTKGVLNFSDRRNVAADIATLQHSRQPMFERLAKASATEISADPKLSAFANAAGQAAFGDNCATCHGSGGAGRPGFPVLADDVWIWGGSLSDIEHTIRVGVRSSHPQTRMSQMPAYGRDGLLTPEQINDATEYVISLSNAKARLKPNMVAAGRGGTLFQEQCAACHGVTGQGNRDLGAPSLVDDVWLYGGSREEIHRQIELGRGGVMPTWEKRFDAGTLRALAYYVHAMGGGEAEPVAADVGTPPVPVADPATIPVTPEGGQ